MDLPFTLPPGILYAKMAREPANSQRKGVIAEIVEIVSLTSIVCAEKWGGRQIKSHRRDFDREKR